MSKKVLVVFDDPGGGLAVSSLIKKLKDKNIEVKIFAGKHNTKMLNERELDHTVIESMIEKESSGKIINEFKPELLLTGTSGGNAEQEFRNIAFEKDLKSVVVLDFWKDYSRRWMYSNYPISEMRDSVCVMDELTKTEMLQENFPEEKLKVCGNPYLDELFQKKENSDEDHETGNYLFLSQPLGVIGIKDYECHPLEILIKGFLNAEKRNIGLTIKLHPLEKKSEELEAIIEKYDTDNFKIVISDESLPLKEMILKSEAVIGYNTIAMFEARALNKRTISLNVVPVRDSLTQAMNKAGIETVNADEESISICLKNTSKQKTEGNPFEGSIEKCIEVILKELNLN